MKPMSDRATSDPGPTRRTFLAGAGAAAVAGLTAACADSAEPATTTAAAEVAQPENAAAPEPTAAAPALAAVEAVAFGGARQQGVLAPVTAAGLVASFDVLVDSRADLASTLQDLSQEVDRIMSGEPPTSVESHLPPVDSGAVDRTTSTRGTAITLGVGASLFDDRFGLADRRPSELIAMPRFRNDRLVRPELSDGDLALTITGPSQQSVVYALHQAVRVTDRRLRLRWVQEGYNDLLPPSPDRVAPTRNLMGFHDGSSNIDTTDAAAMQEHVWVSADNGEPAWAVGGTYQAVRIIRMFIEFWSTAALVRQEQIFGRHRDTGAPLGQSTEAEEPAFGTDASDEGVPRRSHMRLANPRTSDTALLLRRGFSYLNGVDVTSATMDQGLLFTCYQRSLNRGFLATQARLDGEPLEDYIKPVGGGLFFVLPGPGTGADAWLGESLLS